MVQPLRMTHYGMCVEEQSWDAYTADRLRPPDSLSSTDSDDVIIVIGNRE